MTPADEITAAADLLEPLATIAQADLETDDYWSGYEPRTAWYDGMTNGMGGASGDLAGAIPPAAVTELARWLRAEARHLPGPHALAIARAITSSQP